MSYSTGILVAGASLPGQCARVVIKPFQRLKFGASPLLRVAASIRLALVFSSPTVAEIHFLDVLDHHRDPESSSSRRRLPR